MNENSTPPIAIDAIPPVAVREGVAAVLTELAHELRNPIAAVQGCAQTLSEHAERMSSSTRMGLTDVIVRHAKRVDWLIGAALALGGCVGGKELEIDLSEVAVDAGRLAGVEVTAPAAMPVWVFRAGCRWPARRC